MQRTLESRAQSARSLSGDHGADRRQRSEPVAVNSATRQAPTHGSLSAGVAAMLKISARASSSSNAGCMVLSRVRRGMLRAHCIRRPACCPCIPCTCLAQRPADLQTECSSSICLPRRPRSPPSPNARHRRLSRTRVATSMAPGRTRHPTGRRLARPSQWGPKRERVLLERLFMTQGHVCRSFRVVFVVL